MIEKIFSATTTKLPAAKLGIPKGDANSVLSNGLDIVYFVAGIAAIIVIIIAGIMYTISGGDAGQTKAAKETILYAVVGLVVILMAFTITGFVTGRFG